MNSKWDGLAISVIVDGQTTHGIDIADIARLKKDYLAMGFKDFAKRYLEPAFAQLFNE